MALYRERFILNNNKNNKNYGIYYYDSNGHGAPLEIKNFVSKIINILHSYPLFNYIY